MMPILISPPCARDPGIAKGSSLPADRHQVQRKLQLLVTVEDIPGAQAFLIGRGQLARGAGACQGRRTTIPPVPDELDHLGWQDRLGDGRDAVPDRLMNRLAAAPCLPRLLKGTLASIRVMQFCHGDLSLPCRAGVPATYGNGSVEVRSVIDGGRPDAVWFAACRA